MKKPIKQAILEVVIAEYPSVSNWLIARADIYSLSCLRRFRELGLDYKYEKNIYWIYTPLKELRGILKGMKSKRHKFLLSNLKRRLSQGSFIGLAGGQYRQIT